ncbi:MAG TPA: hypothetical protein VM101_13195 [Flavitalea sp.]|nr:hypothetical protein [Flavitalea sp.]
MCARIAHFLPWIKTYRDKPYFFTENGENWIPIGQNDAITWPDLKDAFLQKNLNKVEGYFSMLHHHGINCMRLMMEYCHTEHRYFEKPVGQFHNNMITLWDDLFMLAEKYKIRFLITPFDTYWMRRRWPYHPYNKRNGGPCSTTTQWLLSAQMRLAIKNRFSFFTERWGGSGVIFAWDLWNEIHPVHARNEVNRLSHYIEDVGSFLRDKELQLFNTSHLQTVSFYGTSLLANHDIASTALRHAGLDFATIHLYDEPAIDRPKNTVDAAVITAKLTRQILSEINDNRPFFDTEHGPIFTFNNKHITLDEKFDDEYFNNMQWSHFASGGAGGGMRWPYRHPHSLTEGMRKKQYALSEFVKYVDWKTFKRSSHNNIISLSNKHLITFSCGDEQQSVIWLLRNKPFAPRAESFSVSSPSKAKYSVIFWNTATAKIIKESVIDELNVACGLPPFEKDIAIYLKRIN